VPYYRELFDHHGLRPSDIRGIADLPLIPTSAKPDLQNRPVREVVARGIDPRKLRQRRTSGSTGEPAVVRRAQAEWILMRAHRIKILHEMGLKARDRVAVLRIPPGGKARGPIPGVGFLKLLQLYRTELIDCFSSPEQIAREVAAARPDVVLGFPTVLARVAEAVKGNERLRASPRFVITSGEVLTAAMRREIAEAFSAPVRDMYACLEFGVVGAECRNGGAYHAAEPNLIVEVLVDGRPARAGDRGVLVATALHSFAMPFIRYELGDVVTRGRQTCSCGAPFSTLHSIQGRMVDYFALPSGRLVHPFEIVTALETHAEGWIRQYQLLQERPERVSLRIVPRAKLGKEEMDALHRIVGEILGEGDLEVILVDEIRVEPSGKFRPSRSLVQSMYEGVRWLERTVERESWPEAGKSGPDEAESTP
jgi:phenylacetate-CoA ligase